jgi:hypothetical protein
VKINFESQATLRPIPKLFQLNVGIDTTFVDTEYLCTPTPAIRVNSERDGSTNTQSRSVSLSFLPFHRKVSRTLTITITNQSINQSTMKSCIRSSYSCKKHHRSHVSFPPMQNETFLTINIADFTDQEIVNCWWHADDLKRIQRDCKAHVKDYYSNKIKNGDMHAPQFRGLERYSYAQRKAVVLEMSREAILYDHCLETYSLSSRMALREAQERAQRDALAVVNEYEDALAVVSLLLKINNETTAKHISTTSTTTLMGDMTVAEQGTTTTTALQPSDIKQSSSQPGYSSVRSGGCGLQQQLVAARAS